ncbi:MAG: hypothetical protein GX758_01855 [Tenericutes bacterium]|nr:hypothetical protein [Mycoplasmatota bacterium]
MRKERVVFIILFILSFIGTYIIICYLPPFRIKLEAEPIKYFIESLKNASLFKTIVSVAVGTLIAFIPTLVKKRK